MNTTALNKGLHKTRVLCLGSEYIPDPEHGDLKLSVFPFNHNHEWITLPVGFKLWESSVTQIMREAPIQKGAEQHCVTIDSKFFTKDDFLRREGIHIDGNFCVDPNFRTWRDPELFKASWGGGKPKPGWAHTAIKDGHFKPLPNNEHVEMDWVLPYDIVFPVGDYVSGEKGGILTVSTEVGCQAWNGEFVGEILSEGSCKDLEMSGQFTDDKKVLFEKNKLYFMTSNTPHETLMIEKGKRRTFIRITLNHEYRNEAII